MSWFHSAHTQSSSTEMKYITSQFNRSAWEEKFEALESKKYYCTVLGDNKISPGDEDARRLAVDLSSPSFQFTVYLFF